MEGIQTLVLLHLVCISSCMDQLHLLLQWKTLDYQWEDNSSRLEALETGRYIPRNNIPVGLEVFQHRLFLTVPRWKPGVPSSLNYINLKDNLTSPALIPYPNWAAHSFDGEVPPDIVSPLRVRADRCARLWVLDSGRVHTADNGSLPKLYPPALIVYDLRTDNLLRKYRFPSDQVKQDSGFANIALEDSDCDRTYAYSADAGKAGVVVYSWEKNESWRISHHYFHQDPLACDFNVKGLNFTWDDAIFGMGMSAPNANGFATLYFHPMSSFKEFSVSSEFLRNSSVAEANFDAFKNLGDRGPNAQSSVSFLDPKTGVLFYSLVNLNAVACWKTSNREYTMKNQGRIYMDENTMVYPTDIKVDYEDNLWILSNRMPVWKYGKWDVDDVNFRVFSAPVVHAISHTACDITPRTDILDKFLKANTTGAAPPAGPSALLVALFLSWIVCYSVSY